MGWNSGHHIFNPVARELVAAGVADEVVTRVCVTLIKALQDGDWDTEGESLDEFRGHPAIVEAFRRCDVYDPCAAESQLGEHFDECVLEHGHGGDVHKDYKGNTWPKTS